MNFFTAKIFDFDIPRGTSKDLRVQILDELGEPYDVSGYEIKLYMGLNHLRELILEKVGIVSGPSEEGRVRFSFKPEDTADLTSLSYDVSIYASLNDAVWCVFQGKIAVTLTVPREEE